MEIKSKLIQELKDGIYKLNYEIAYIDFIKPETEKLRDDAKAEADVLKEKLDTLAKNGDQKKKAVRDELKALSFQFGKAMQKVGNFQSVIDGAEENKQQYREKIAGYSKRLAFLETYAG